MTAARVRPATRSKIGIPLFAEKPSHPFVPLGDQTAGARSEGQGRPSAGACALPLTAASTLAGCRCCGDRPAWHYAVLLLAGALSVCAGSGVAVAQSVPVERPAAAHPYAAHIAEARRVLLLREAVGRRLDFLMQEFNREANTLGSKAADPRTTKAAVELKVLIEQMREQVQNLE